MARHRRVRPSPRPRSTARTSPAALERIQPHTAGIDCGSAAHHVAVPPDRDPAPVRAFATFTPDLQQLAAWLTACRIKHVVMEATGVYWIPIFELLESRGFQVILVNGRHVKQVPGRKSDVSDCEWLRDLHIFGLLRGSFRPAEEIVVLRGYVRHRMTLIETAGATVQRMQKALVQMNLQLPVVLSDITGTTGLRIIRDIVAGVRDPQQLARHRDPRCQATAAEMIAALTGSYRAEHLFVLQQQLSHYDHLQTLLADCDTTLERYLTTLAAQASAPSTDLPPGGRRQRPQANAPRFDLRALLHRIAGVDLSQIDGIAPYNALRLVAEIGTDMTRWPDAKHFTSWLALAPQNKISGGRLLSSRTPTSANRAAGILRMAALSLTRTNTALGAFYRRLAGRIGKAQALTATARKLAVLVYRTLRDGLVYQDPGASLYDQQQRTRVLRRLQHRAANLGCTLIDSITGEIIGAVS